ncbi:MAG: hypothetical protein IPI62_06125 [Bacteroidetes bacterium]|nr:hypothetical protein [Bacteroidota bacterium]
MYSITGEKNIEEKILNLKGYRNNNKPVRLGNDAYTHIQNDVYGQVMVSLMPLYIDKRLTTQPNSKSIDIIHFLLNKIEETMDQPDAGIWEFRNRQQRHCYTYLFHWAGSRAALKIGKEINNQELIIKAEKLRNLAASNIEKCYSQTKRQYSRMVEFASLKFNGCQRKKPFFC